MSTHFKRIVEQNSFLVNRDCKKEMESIQFIGGESNVRCPVHQGLW
jgi:hypothetical protein